LKRTKKKSKGKGKYVVIASAIILTIIIAVAAVSMTGKSELPKASQYFSISWAEGGVLAKPYLNSSIIITFLTVNITAIGGDGTEVIVFLRYKGVSADSGASVDMNSKLVKGESWEVGIQYPSMEGMGGLVVSIVDGKAVLRDVLTIGCHETTEETMTFRIPLEEITFLPG